MITEQERIAWGATEDALRKADIAAVKAGTMELETAQKNARRRARQSGMTPREAYRAFVDAQRLLRSPAS